MFSFFGREGLGFRVWGGRGGGCEFFCLESLILWGAGFLEGFRALGF